MNYKLTLRMKKEVMICSVVSGFLVEVDEGVEYTSRLVLGYETQGSKKKGTFLSYTEKKLRFKVSD